jgi:hypothetical protein
MVPYQSQLCIYTGKKQQSEILNIPMKVSPHLLLHLLVTFGYWSTSEQILFLFLLLLSLPHVPQKFLAFITHFFFPLLIVEDYLA